MSKFSKTEWVKRIRETNNREFIMHSVFDTKAFCKFLIKWDDGIELDEEDFDSYMNWEVVDFYNEFFEPSDTERDYEQMLELVADYLASKEVDTDDLNKAIVCVG